MRHLILIISVAIALWVAYSNQKEGWRPFAWYGYSGYQARGDWCGVVPGTTTTDKPLPLIPAEVCSRKVHPIKPFNSETCGNALK